MILQIYSKSIKVYYQKTTNIVKRWCFSLFLADEDIQDTGFCSIFADESTMKGWSELV